MASYTKFDFGNRGLAVEHGQVVFDINNSSGTVYTKLSRVLGASVVPYGTSTANDRLHEVFMVIGTSATFVPTANGTDAGFIPHNGTVAFTRVLSSGTYLPGTNLACNCFYTLYGQT